MNAPVRFVYRGRLATSRTAASIDIPGRVRVVGPRLFRVALRVLGSRADAEDVVQQTFTDAVRAGDGFRGDASLDTWLWQIGRRCIGKALRRRQRKEIPVLPLAALGPQAEPACDAPSLDDLTDQRRLVDLAVECLAELPAADREIIALRDLEDMPIAEIAGLLAVGIPAAKSRLHRARLGLRHAVTTRLNASKENCP